MHSASFQINWHPSIQDFSAQDWQVLAAGHPFLDFDFLAALEVSEAVGGRSGWIPHYLGLTFEGRLVAAMPLYFKTHSYGEYVFDWAWADAYEKSGGQYYPKLLSAIPFSPVTGPRLLLHPSYLQDESIPGIMLSALEALCLQHHLSGVHILFPDAVSSAWCDAQGWLSRKGVQFRWENSAYENFESFLATLGHDKRKKIRQERKKVSAQSVQCRSVSARQATDKDWALFYKCYCETYYQHGSQPYLPETFFQLLADRMPDQVILFIAAQGAEQIAASLCVIGGNTLYGRYWGALREISCLHFELCYYQPQQFCIERGIRFFEGGAQGVHKLARGFSPYQTHSFHWITHVGFRQSVARFLANETEMMQGYINELEERTPYKR